MKCSNVSLRSRSGLFSCLSRYLPKQDWYVRFSCRDGEVIKKQKKRKLMEMILQLKLKPNITWQDFEKHMSFNKRTYSGPKFVAIARKLIPFPRFSTACGKEKMSGKKKYHIEVLVLNVLISYNNMKRTSIIFSIFLPYHWANNYIWHTLLKPKGMSLVMTVSS